MNYGRAMPDWPQQYSTLQSSGETERQQQQQVQVQANNVSPGSVQSPVANGANYTLECLTSSSNNNSNNATNNNNNTKSQNDYYGRSNGSMAHSPLATNGPAQQPQQHMSNCGYGLDTTVPSPVEDQRTAQMSLSSPNSRMQQQQQPMGGGMSALGQLMTGHPPPPPNTSSAMQASRQTGSYPTCKGPCCQPPPPPPAPAPAYRTPWDKMSAYQSSAHQYRPGEASVHPTAPSPYALEAGTRTSRYHHRTDPYRKEPMAYPPIDLQQQQQQQIHQQQQQQQLQQRGRYPATPQPRKEPNQVQQPTVNRGYQPQLQQQSSYPMQPHYGYPPEYQKYYSPRPGAAGVIKYPPQQQQPQQQYHQPQQANGVMMPPPPSSHPGYYNPAPPQMTEYPPANNGPDAKEMHAKYLHYQKLSLQRIDLEKALRDFSKIPGCQKHPEYLKCLTKYREVTKYLQNMEYGYQQAVQQPAYQQQMPAPINLQFDQNGVLINSSLVTNAGGYVQTQQQILHEKTNPYDAGKSMQPMDHMMMAQQQQQHHQHQLHRHHHPSMMPPPLPQQHPGPEQPQQHILPHHQQHYLTQEYHHATHHHHLHHHHLQQQQQQQLHQQQQQQHPHLHQLQQPQQRLDDDVVEIPQQKPSEEFADKPHLDVRQFLANWQIDENEEEDGNVVLSDSTPIVVLEYLEPPSSTTASSPKDDVPQAPLVECIESGVDEVPTIHIVDTLENSEAVVKGTFQSLDQAEMKSIEDLVNKTAEQESETSVKDKEEEEQPAEEEERKTQDDVSTSTSEQSVAPENPKATEKTSETPAPASNNLNLSSSTFVNGNHDDLSLPELPTSECTPLSTTLNTPNHSDNEEESSEMRDTRSSLIDFNHPSIKFPKESTGDELQFDFANEISKDAGDKAADKPSNEDSKADKDNESPKTQEPTQRNENPTPTAGAHSSIFNFSEFSNSSSTPLGEEPKMPIPPMEENCLTKIIKDTPPITNLRVLDSDDDLTVDKVNDIWMDINLDNSLSNSSNRALSADDSLLLSDRTHRGRRSSLRHFRKNKYGGVCSIMDRSLSLDSSKEAMSEPFTDTTSDIVKQIINLEKSKEMPVLDDSDAPSPCDLSEETEFSEMPKETEPIDVESSRTLGETIEKETSESTSVRETPVETTSVDDSSLLSSKEKCDNLNVDKEQGDDETKVDDLVLNQSEVEDTVTVNEITENEKDVDDSNITKVVDDADKVPRVIINSRPLSKDSKTRKSLDSSMRNIIFDRPRKRAKSEELDDRNKSVNQDELLKEFQDIKRKRIFEQQDHVEVPKKSVEYEFLQSDTDKTKNDNLDSTVNNTNDANPDASSKSDSDHKVINSCDSELNLNSSVSCNPTVNNNVSDSKTGNNTNNENNSDENSSLTENVCKNSSLPLLPDTKPVRSSKRRFSIFDPEEISVEKTETTTSNNCIDSNINIQLPNVNLQIKDKTETTGTYNNVSKDSIKIEINVSRVESQRTTDNPVVSTSNQQLNISLPPSSPISCKVDCKKTVSASEEEKETRKLDSPALSVREVVEEKSLGIEKDNEAEPTVEEVTDEENIIAIENKNAQISDNNSLVLENKNKKEMEPSNVSSSMPDKKETDANSAVNDKQETNEETVAPKESDKSSKDALASTPGCSKDFDFDDFDVEPCTDKIGNFHNNINRSCADKDKYGRNHGHSRTVGFLNPLFHLEELENLDSVPMYTTKDGLQYCENRKYTYRTLIIEARKREGHRGFWDYYDKKSPRSKRKKRSRSKHKSTHYKPRYDGEVGTFSESSSYENFTANEHDEIEELKDDDCDNKFDNSDYKLPSLSTRLKVKDLCSERNENFTNNLLFNKYSPKTPRSCSPAIVKTEEMGLTSPKWGYSEDSKKCSSPERDIKILKKNIVDLKDLEENILKKLKDHERHCARLDEFAFHQIKSIRSEVVNIGKKCVKNDKVSNIQQTVQVVEQVLNAFESDMFEIDVNKNDLYDEIDDISKIPMPADVDKNHCDIVTEVHDRNSVGKLSDDKEYESDVILENNSIIKETLHREEGLEYNGTHGETINESKLRSEGAIENNKTIEFYGSEKFSETTETFEGTKTSFQPNESSHTSEKICEISKLNRNEVRISRSHERDLALTKEFLENEINDTERTLFESTDVDLEKDQIEKLETASEKAGESHKPTSPFDHQSHDFAESNDSKENLRSPSAKSQDKETANELNSKEARENLYSKRPNRFKELSPKHKSEVENHSRESKRALKSQDNLVVSSADEETEKELISKRNVIKPSSPPSLICSINRKSFSFELCNNFIAQEKHHADQVDVGMKTVPKLVIRKSETNPKVLSKSKSIDGSNHEDLKKDSPTHPKIPKMIIRNARSRPGTPSIEEISETGSPESDGEAKPIKFKIKFDDSSEKIQNSSDSSEAKVPKMKIKLEERLPRVVIENIKLTSFENQKMIPKMKITNVKGSVPKIMEKQSQTELDNDKSDTNSSFSENENTRTRDKSRSRPKKDSPGHSSSSESSVKRSSSGSSSQSKKSKRSPKEEVNLDPILEETQFSMENEYKQKNSSSNSSSSKIPKVIIKRASPSAEFKCELSKEAIVNAQPQVVLMRMKNLDSMAKNLKSETLENKVQAPVDTEEVQAETKPESNEMQWERFISGLKRRRELSRSNSTSDLHRLSSPKIKRRRTSDFVVGTLDYADSDSATPFGFVKQPYCGEPELSDLTSFKNFWRSLDENMNSKSKPDELETIVEAGPILEEMPELQAIPPNMELLDNDVDVHEVEVDGTMDEFETSVIKVDSSDESQTTIEILAASPHDVLSQQLDTKTEGAEEQIYVEDQVPMHFEYELEVVDEPVDVPRESLDETDKSSSTEIKHVSGILITDQLEIEDDNTSETTTNINDIIQHQPVVIIEALIDPAEKQTAPEVSNETTETFWNSEQPAVPSVADNVEISNASDFPKTEFVEPGCSYSDLLVKEVLAAKETLKKYLGSLSSTDKGDGKSSSGKKSSTKSKSRSSSKRSICSTSNFRHRDERKKVKSKNRHSDSSRTSSSGHSNDSKKSTTTTSSIDATNSSTSSTSCDSKSKTKNHGLSNGKPAYKIPKLSSKQAESLVRAVEENLAKEKSDVKAPEATIEPDEDAAKRPKNVISKLDDLDFYAKLKAVQLNPETTISSIVRDLVFHDKATIRHRRYCMLCERWFPSTLRHRRHLAGYQHRHTELTQRRAIHILFLIFTGKLCPKLLPPNVLRTDCAPGELTPLQIAVQDFATVFKGMQPTVDKQSDESKE